MEPDGKLSILKKPDYQTPNKKDLGVKITAPKYIPTEIIVDGKVVPQNLMELGLTMSWLTKQLRIQGYNSSRQIFYAELQSDGSLFIFETQ